MTDDIDGFLVAIQIVIQINSFERFQVRDLFNVDIHILVGVQFDGAKYSMVAKHIPEPSRTGLFGILDANAVGIQFMCIDNRGALGFHNGNRQALVFDSLLKTPIPTQRPEQQRYSCDRQHERSQPKRKTMGSFGILG